MKRLLAFGLSVITVFALSFGTVPSPAQAQVTLPGDLSAIVVDLLVEVDQGACAAEGCRNVTFDALLSVDETTEAALTGAQLANVEAALDAAVVEIRVTDSEDETRVIGDGDTVCLPPGETTVSATVLNADVVADAIVEALDITLEVGTDALDLVDIGTFSDNFDVADCPDDGGTPPPEDGDDGTGGDGNINTGEGDDQVTGDLTAGQCQAIINNNSGNQNNPSIVQNCIQIINEATNGGGNGDDHNGNGTTTDNGTTNINGNTDLDSGVLTNTIPPKPLPITGGISFLTVTGLALLGAGLGISLIRRR